MGEISSKNQNRIVWVDCMRALLIICMVCGHTGSPYNTYIYMMHMPGFLVLSGFTSYLACTKKSYRPAEYIKKRILSILIPAILVNTVFYLFYWMMEKLNLYTFVQAEPYRPLGGSLLSFVKNLRTTDVGGGRGSCLFCLKRKFYSLYFQQFLRACSIRSWFMSCARSAVWPANALP